MDDDFRFDILAYKESLEIRLPEDSYIFSFENTLHHELEKITSLPAIYKRYDFGKKCCDPLCGWYAVVHEYCPLSKSPMNEGWGWGLVRWKASSKHLVTLRLLTFQYIFYWGKFFRVPYLNVSNPSVLIAFHMTDSINSPFKRRICFFLSFDNIFNY